MATTLYLVSAETPQGEGYWKVGVTAKTDPLKRDPKSYREVFRAQVFEDAEVAKDVELAVAKVFKALAPTPYGRETLAYSAGLEVAAAVFDFCFEERVKWERVEWAPTGDTAKDYVSWFTTVTFFCRKEKPAQDGTSLMPWGAKVRTGKREAFEIANAPEMDWDRYVPVRDHVMCFPDKAEALDAIAVPCHEEAAWGRYFDMVEACQQIIDAVVVGKPTPEPMWA